MTLLAVSGTSPPDAVQLRFGEDSFRPHLAAAGAAGFVPAVVPLPGIALDIDGPVHYTQRIRGHVDQL